MSLRDIWRHWDALLRTSYTEEELASWHWELAANQLSDTRLNQALRQGEATDLELRLQSLETRISQFPKDSADPARSGGNWPGHASPAE